MPITVAEMLGIPGFSDLKVLAGEKGLTERAVTGVTVVDAPDAMPWIRGGEFVIGSGYIFSINDISTFLRFVEDFNRLGISAIGIKVSRFLKKIPEDVLQKADELNLPIIDIPYRYAFADIIDPVMSVVLNKAVEKLRYSETVSRSFFELITGGGEIDEILSHLNKFIGKNIAYHDLLTGNHFFCSVDEQFERYFSKNTLGKNVSNYPYVTVKQNGRIFGYLIFDTNFEDTDKEIWEITLYHARTALLLHSQKEILKREVENRYRNEFVQDILFKNLRFEKELWNRSLTFGWELEKPQTVVVFDIDNYKSNFRDIPPSEKTEMLHSIKQRIYNIIEGFMKSGFGIIPYTTMSDSVVFLVPYNRESKEEFKPFLDEVLTNISIEVRDKSGFSLSIGVGNTKESVFQVNESYIEARKALEMARTTFGDDRITWWKDLGLYKILGNLDDSDEIRDFCKEYLGKIIRSDKNRETQYIRTLEILINNNFALKNTADELSIHFNTLKHRINRIEEISGISLNSSEDRINLTFALKLYHMKNLLDFIK